MNNLTDKEFWRQYWSDHVAYDVPENQYYDFLVQDIISNSKEKSFIELGGFPGYNCIYFAKKYGLNCTILDFFVEKEVVNKIETKNKLDLNTINIIEEDLFNYTPTEKFDLTMSIGLIEHFQDTKEIISKHVQFMKPNSECLIILPNFKGLNGFLNKTFDNQNYIIHNIKSMDIDLLKSISKELGMLNIECDYFAKPMVWLEPKKTNKISRKFVRLISFMIKLLPIKGKLLSPYIYLKFTN